MPGFNRPDFPEVSDNKINIGDHRDGMPLRVTDLYQEIGSLSNEPTLKDQILTPSIVPETMEQKITNAINDFLNTGLKKSKKQTVIEAFAEFVKQKGTPRGDAMKDMGLPQRTKIPKSGAEMGATPSEVKQETAAMAVGKAIDLTNAPKPPKEMMDQAKTALAGARTARRAAKNGKPASGDELTKQLIKALTAYAE